MAEEKSIESKITFVRCVISNEDIFAGTSNTRIIFLRERFDDVDTEFAIFANSNGIYFSGRSRTYSTQEDLSILFDAITKSIKNHNEIMPSYKTELIVKEKTV